MANDDSDGWGGMDEPKPESATPSVVPTPLPQENAGPVVKSAGRKGLSLATASKPAAAPKAAVDAPPVVKVEMPAEAAAPEIDFFADMVPERIAALESQDSAGKLARENAPASLMAASFGDVAEGPAAGEAWADENHELDFEPAAGSLLPENREAGDSPPPLVPAVEVATQAPNPGDAWDDAWSEESDN